MREPGSMGWGGRAISFNKQTASILTAFFLLAVLPFLVNDYWQNLFVLSFYYVILASSWNLTSGYGGMFLLNIETYAGISAYTSALAYKLFGLPLVLGIPLGVGMSAIASLAIAILTLRMSGIYLALTTWAFAEITRIVMATAYNITGGGYGIVTPYLFGGSSLVFSYVFMVTAIGIVGILYKLLGSGFGKMLVAVRQDPIGAAACGVNVFSIRVQANLIAGIFCGIAGGFLAHYIGIVTPTILEFNEMANIIVMVIIGGFGTLAGPILGGAFVTVLLSAFQQYGQWRLVVFAIVALAVARLYRGGLVKLMRTTWKALYQGQKR